MMFSADVRSLLLLLLLPPAPGMRLFRCSRMLFQVLLSLFGHELARINSTSVFILQSRFFSLFFDCA